ncbi:hypothetical protein HD554DRAFT_2092421 [Boletus coccyginus]|nr:hypothetical protein HD554DRAFT_2092421 [Boletus coccyginus]
MSELILPVDGRGAGDLKVTTFATSDIPPLSVGYRLSPEQTSFFKEQTGIDDDEALKNHILGVKERASKIFPYPCIQVMTFLEHGMAVLPAYKDVLKLGRERPDEILLDLGACFGVDARKAAADGYPLRNIVTTDLQQAFFDLGHDLFKTTPASYPINFVAGDVFKPSMLQIFPPFDEPPHTERPDLSTLTSLNPLAGHCAAIYVGNIFHLFSEENQLHLARALAGLLSPLPGSVIFGIHGSNPQKGVFRSEYNGKVIEAFCHSPESWAAVWNGEVFAKGKVKVDATGELVERERFTFWQLRWSVVKL